MTTIDMKEYLNNPLKILHRLKEAGFSQEQAEAQAEVISSCFENSKLASKDDITSIAAKTGNSLLIELKELEIRMTYKVAAIVGFFYILEKFF